VFSSPAAIQSPQQRLALFALALAGGAFAEKTLTCASATQANLNLLDTVADLAETLVIRGGTPKTGANTDKACQVNIAPDRPFAAIYAKVIGFTQRLTTGDQNAAATAETIKFYSCTSKVSVVPAHHVAHRLPSSISPTKAVAKVCENL
jgi:hypothetical protein